MLKASSISHFQLRASELQLLGRDHLYFLMEFFKALSGINQLHA